MSSFPVIRTPRLLLRELTAQDAPRLLEIHGNALAMRYFGTDPLRGLPEAERLVAKFVALREAPNPGARWAITLEETGELVGTCGVFGWNREWHECSTGYELAEGARGNGYMQEALRGVFDWAFSKMELHRIEAQVHPHNEASLKLVERLGFRREGLLREVARWGGAFHDLVQLGLLRREWRAAVGAPGPGRSIDMPAAEA